MNTHPARTVVAVLGMVIAVLLTAVIVLELQC